MSRAETPEPSRLQGRRNVITEVQLLDGEGAISDQLELCLKYIFGKYCVPPPLVSADLNSSAPLANTGRAAFELRTVLPEGAYLTQEGLDSWAQDTNGAPFPQETKDELVEFLDVTDAGELTFKGFLQIYQLQTENDEEETWRDLSNHGFDRTLRLVTTRREDVTESAPGRTL